MPRKRKEEDIRLDRGEAIKNLIGSKGWIEYLNPFIQEEIEKAKRLVFRENTKRPEVYIAIVNALEKILKKVQCWIEDGVDAKIEASEKMGEEG